MDMNMFLSQAGVAQRCTSIKSAVIHTSLGTLIPSLIVHHYVSKCDYLDFNLLLSKNLLIT